MRTGRSFIFLLILTIILTGCSMAGEETGRSMTSPVPASQASPTQPPAAVTPTGKGVSTMTPDTISKEGVFTLTSSAFQPQQKIPTRYTCDGEDISPPLEWKGSPVGTKSFALILDDPDAPSGTFTHWVLYNLPASRFELAEGASTAPELKPNHGMTSWRKTVYGGPCPPSAVHHYIFTLYAIDTTLTLPAGASKKEVLAALQGHILGQAELAGLYGRS